MNSPEELEAEFTRRFNTHEVAAFLELFADGAVFVEPQEGLPLTGDQVREGFAGLFADKPTLDTDPPQVVGAGDIALIVVGWRLDETAGTAANVARRQPDGTWRYVIVNPAGTAMPVPTGA